MSIFDHRKSWTFRLHADDVSCVQAFSDAFSGGRHMLKAKWEISRGANGVVAVYKGRAVRPSC